MKRRSLSVVVVVVTYGDRSDMALQVCRAARASGANRVLLIANGSTDAALGLLFVALATDPWLEMIQIERNTGSAGGFHVGLAMACRGTEDYVWLLDDDNVPATGALVALMQAAQNHTEDAAFVCDRPCDPGFHERVVGRKPDPVAGAFLHFDVVDRLARRRPAVRTTGSLSSAPYGGLFMSQRLLRKTELPDPSFVLYEDDTDFTLRLARRCVPILPVKAAIINEIDVKWSTSSRRISRLLSAPDSARVYYGVRNRVRVDLSSARREDRLLRFGLNMVVFVTLRLVLESRSLRRASVRAVLRGIRDGLSGTTGVWPGAGMDLSELPQKWTVSPMGARSQFVRVNALARDRPEGS